MSQYLPAAVARQQLSTSRQQHRRLRSHMVQMALAAAHQNGQRSFRPRKGERSCCAAQWATVLAGSSK
jgi:hypothetical protein